MRSEGTRVHLTPALADELVELLALEEGLVGPHHPHLHLRVQPHHQLCNQPGKFTVKISTMARRRVLTRFIRRPRGTVQWEYV
jgi:hypothetical protein